MEEKTTANMKGVRRTELDNGLVILTEKRPNTKKAALLAGVRVGSVDETERVSGGSHFNEHLLFKSNKHRTSTQISEDLEYTGTIINAYTTWKYTAFTAKAPYRHLPTAVEVLYQAATNYEYLQNEFDTERQVILTEIQNFINAPDRHSLTGLFIPELFKGTTLESKIEGTVDSMGAVTKEELEKFKERYYAPNNMIISAVGKFNEDKLIDTIREFFGGLDEQKVPRRNPVLDLSNRKLRKAEKRKDISQTYMCLGYRVPGHAGEDIHNLEMISGLLSEGLSSRMYKELREKRGIGYSVGSIFYPLEEEGMFIAHAEGFDPRRTAETEEVITGIFHDLQKNQVPSREFAGTKTLMNSRHEDHLEKITERAMMLLETELYDIPYDFREKEKHIEKITKDNVMEAAQRYLTDDYTLTLLEPEN